MSVERVERKDGSVVWRVRWRQGGRNRSKVLGRKRDAEAFDAELVRRKRTGELAQLDAGKELLSDFGEEWWRLYASPRSAVSARSYRLRPSAWRRSAGCWLIVGGRATRRSYRCSPMQGCGQARRSRSRAHVRERTLLVERAVSLGEIEGTKTGRRRTVPLVGPLVHDLDEWRLHAGRPAADALVFPGHDGEPWTATAYRNWRRRIYIPRTARRAPARLGGSRRVALRAAKDEP